MFPFIDPYPWSPTYNSPGMATVNVADDKSALSSLYPARDYRQKTGTIVGRVVAKDGVSQTHRHQRHRPQRRQIPSMRSRASPVTARRGLVGADGTFEITGLTPGAKYVVYIDQIGAGGFSTPKAILLGPEEYWNAGESSDATLDDACAATKIVLNSGETRHIRIAMNGIDRAPSFTYLPYSLPLDLSDNGERVIGLYGPFQSPYWTWSRQRGMENIDGVGFMGAVSGDGRVVGGTHHEAGRDRVRSGRSGACRALDARTWLEVHRRRKLPGLRHLPDQRVRREPATARRPWDSRSRIARTSTRSSGPRRGGMRRLGKTSEGAARANAVSGDGNVVGGWEEIPEAFGFRVGSHLAGARADAAHGSGAAESIRIRRRGHGSERRGHDGGRLRRRRRQQGCLQVDPRGRHGQHRPLPRARLLHVLRLGDRRAHRDMRGSRDDRDVDVSNDGKVITGASRLLNLGVDDAAIYTRGLGWMLMTEFLASQGVLEMSRWHVLGASVSGDGKVLTGTAFPLAADYYHGYRLELDQVFVCHDKRRGGSHAASRLSGCDGRASQAWRCDRAVCRRRAAVSC